MLIYYYPKISAKGSTFSLSRRWALIRVSLSTSPTHKVGERGRKMPPKKKEAEGPGPLLGRFGTSLKCGIVGLPNVG